MATTTPNYGWPVPTSTDFVKDGATAIEALGDAIDATVFGLPSGGLTLISTAAFSGATSHSFGSNASPIFTSAYRNYKIIIDNLSAPSEQVVSFRIRDNTTDFTGTNYDTQNLFALSTTLGGSRSLNQTSAAIGVTSQAAVTSSIVLDITVPQLALYKNIQSSNLYYANAEGPRVSFYYSSIGSNVAYNGFTIFAGANISGQISIYGYDI
jgi:hypothetical protein